MNALPMVTFSPRLQKLALLLARGCWMILFLLLTGLFIASMAPYIDYVKTLCYAACSPDRLTPTKLHDLEAMGLSLAFGVGMIVTVQVISFLGWSIVSLLIFWRKSTRPFPLLAAFFLLVIGASISELVFDSFAAAHPEWALLIHLLLAVGAALFYPFLLLFPDGRFVPRWSCWLALAWIIQQGSASLKLWVWPGALVFGYSAILFAIGIATQVYRYRTVSDVAQRQQTKWVVLGIAVSLVGLFSAFLLTGLFPAIEEHFTIGDFLIGWSFWGFFLVIPLSVGIALLHSHLWDVDIVLNRALVYGILTFVVAGGYILVVVTLGTLIPSGNQLLLSLVATSLVAVLFQPLRLRLQSAINRLMYGQRDEPYAVVTRLSQRLEGTLAPEAVLPTIVETVAQALKLPYAAISLKQDEAFAVVASYGKPIDDPLILSLTYQGETVGQLLLSPRTPGEAFTSNDSHLLDQLARHAGLAAHAVRLTAALQRSREHLIMAREEERRRLRRDLHDGLGSALTSVMFKMDATDELLDRDPVTARALLTEVRAQTQASIDDIRRLVYNLRPPILDEWGLLAALREHVVQYNLKNVQVSIEAPPSLPPLPAAVEIAVYRIVLEALANVIKHAQATCCTIRLHLMDDALTLEVQDDGLGRRTSCLAGVGMTAMRERAEELGGWCMVKDAEPHGTRVLARVPLRKE